MTPPSVWPHFWWWWWWPVHHCQRSGSPNLCPLAPVSASSKSGGSAAAAFSQRNNIEAYQWVVLQEGGRRERKEDRTHSLELHFSQYYKYFMISWCIIILIKVIISPAASLLSYCCSATINVISVIQFTASISARYHSFQQMVHIFHSQLYSLKNKVWHHFVVPN